MVVSCWQMFRIVRSFRAKYGPTKALHLESALYFSHCALVPKRVNLVAAPSQFYLFWSVIRPSGENSFFPCIFFDVLII